MSANRTRQNTTTSARVFHTTLITNCRSRADCVFSMLIFAPNQPPRIPMIGPRIAPAIPMDAAAFAAPPTAVAPTTAALVEVAITGRAANTPSVNARAGCRLPQRAFHERRDLFRQHRSPAREPLLHRVLAQLQRVGDLGDGLMLPVK